MSEKNRVHLELSSQFRNVIKMLNISVHGTHLHSSGYQNCPNLQALVDQILDLIRSGAFSVA